MAARTLLRRCAAACIFTAVLSAGVIGPSDRLTEDERIEILRDLTAEFGKAKVIIPKAKKPLEFNSDGTWDKDKWEQSARSEGVTARLGDQIKITKVTFAGDHLVLDLNGGIKGGRSWKDHIQVGVGASSQPITNNNAGDYAPVSGTTVAINFHHPMEHLTTNDIKRILIPLIDFDKRSATQLYTETLPPALKQAIQDKRVVEGMDRDQVILALGRPEKKYRETNKEGLDTEDWIYGKPPGKITFVTFAGSKVIKVKEQYAGLGIETR